MATWLVRLAEVVAVVVMHMGMQSVALLVAGRYIPCLAQTCKVSGAIECRIWVSFVRPLVFVGCSPGRRRPRRHQCYCCYCIRRRILRKECTPDTGRCTWQDIPVDRCSGKPVGMAQRLPNSNRNSRAFCPFVCSPQSSCRRPCLWRPAPVVGRLVCCWPNRLGSAHRQPVWVQWTYSAPLVSISLVRHRTQRPIGLGGWVISWRTDSHRTLCWRPFCRRFCNWKG